MDSIIFNNVSKEYRDFALRDVSFPCRGGSIMGLIGENGAGKTTAIKLLLNMIRADKGTIEVFGLGHVENERKIKEQIGVVMEEDCFYESLKCKDVAAIMRNIFKTWDDALFHSLTKKFRPAGKQKTQAVFPRDEDEAVDRGGAQPPAKAAGP